MGFMGYFGGKWSDMLIRSGISVTLSRKIVQVSPCLFFYMIKMHIYMFYLQSMILMTLQKSLDLSSICSFGCEGLEIKKKNSFTSFVKILSYICFISLYFLVIQPDMLQ